MAIGYEVNNVDFDLIFAPNLSGTFSAASNIEAGSVDLNTRYEKLSFGTAAAATGYETAAGGADVNTLWAAIGTPVYNMPLPIQGLTMGQTVQLPSGSGSAQITFLALTSGWTVTSSATGGVGVPTNTPQSGAIPSGATQIQITATVHPGDAAGIPTNTCATPTAIPGSGGVGYQLLTSGTGSPGQSAGQDLVIKFFNASSALISMTTCTFFASRGL